MNKWQPYLDYFQNTYSKMKTNFRLLMYTPNWTVWYPFCLLWSKIVCFRDEIVSYKWPIHISGKITTVPRLFSEHLLQNDKKHQIMIVHTKWNCLIPILSTLVITCFRPENITYKWPIPISGKITTIPTIFRTLTPKWKQTSDYECTHQMELFDTHFAYFGQVLLVSGLKT